MIFDLLANAAQGPGDLVVDGTAVAYAALAERSLRVASALREWGVGRGTTVALMLGADLDYIASLLACAALGAVAMPLNPRYERAELTRLFQGARPALAITYAKLASKCRDAVAETSLELRVATVDGADDPLHLGNFATSMPLATPVICADTDDAFLFHSSGSTGGSKLIRRTHGQMMAEVESFAQGAQTHSEDVFFATVPLYHAHGFGNCLLAALRARARLVVFPDQLNALLARDMMAEAVQAHGVTVFPAVPMTFENLAKTSRTVDFSRARLCFTAGTGLPEATFRAFTERFGVTVRQLYGCSEGGALSLNTDEDLETSWNSVGKALPGVNFDILDPDAEGIGEIAVQSSSLTKGYDNVPEVNAQCFVNGWFRTGDRGRLDGNGKLFVTGKRAFYIEVAGHKIDPYEIEDVLASHPALREAAVLGIPGPGGRGTIVKAVVVARAADKPNDLELRRFCSSHLADYKVPRVIEYRDELPKSPLGKILKKYLV
jgi:long-chain acyl-CoA synthetase